MRRPILFLAQITLLCCFSVSYAQTTDEIVRLIGEYGKFDRWCVRSVKEAGIIGGQIKYLYEFYGDGDTTHSREPFVSPKNYLWRTNNVLANVAGVVKTSTTVFPEPRDSGYCARIETHIEEVKALGIVNMDVVCQGALLVGKINEPIRDTKDPMAKVFYGIPFNGRPSALVFDYKADVGYTTMRGTGFSRLKPMDYPDYPQAIVILQKRWEDEDGKVHAKRVGTGMMRFLKSESKWVNGYRLGIHYGDITHEPYYEDYMGLNNNPDTAYHTLNSRGKNVAVSEDGWAVPDEQPNFMVIAFLGSCHEAFYGGVGNTLWVDNVHLEM